MSTNEAGTLGQPRHALSNISLDTMTADCRVCGTSAPVRKLGSVKSPVCETKLLDTRRARRKKLMAENRAGYNAYHRNYGRIRKYGLTTSLEEFLAQAGGRCAICSTELTVDTMRIDHDHSCCVVERDGKTCGQCNGGVLCNPCNRGLGLLGDDVAGLTRALRYLQQER